MSTLYAQEELTGLIHFQARLPVYPPYNSFGQAYGSPGPTKTCP